MSDNEHDVHVGYVMDIAWVRKSPSDEVLERASPQTTECALTGHCIESGFALIGDDGRLQGQLDVREEHVGDPAAPEQDSGHDGAAIGAFALDDRVREGSRQAVDALHGRGVKVAMIIGDARAGRRRLATELGIDEVLAEVLPEDKDAKVTELQGRGRKVAMIGDGINDAPALRGAAAGMAIGAGTDVAIESAAIVLASDDPRAVVSVIELSRASYRKMLQNLAWAAGYNVFAIPLAAGVLAGVGFVLPPAVGAVLMSASTVVVALNAQLLRRVDLQRDTVPAEPSPATA